MGTSEPKQRATFSIDKGVKDQLEQAVPKSKRSSFVERAIARALAEDAKREALEAIRRFKPFPLKGPGAVETLRQVRAERDEQLAPGHSPAAE